MCHLRAIWSCVHLVHHMRARWHCKGCRWHHMGAIHLQCVAHGFHTVHTTLMWPQCIPYGSHSAHAVPIWHHPPPTWSTELPCGFQMAQVVPIWCMQLLYGTIHLPNGYIRLPYGAHCSHTVPVPMWPPCSGCSSHIVPSASIWCSQLPYGPVWCTWLLYDSHGPIQCIELLYGSIHLPYGYPIWHTGSRTVHTTSIRPHTVYVALIWCHSPPKCHHLIPQ
jgi:hypothetical protein